MCNCNQKRASFSTHDATKRNEYEARQGMVQAKLLQADPLTVNGDVTGRTYRFKKREDIIWVDKRDVNGLQQTERVQVIF